MLLGDSGESGLLIATMEVVTMLQQRGDVVRVVCNKASLLVRHLREYHRTVLVEAVEEDVEAVEEEDKEEVTGDHS